MSVACRVSTGLLFHSSRPFLAIQAIATCPRISAAATLDRYTIIRNYFRGHHTRPNSKQSFSSGQSLCTMHTLSLRYQCRPVSETLPRAFHATCLRHSDEMPKPSPNEQFPSQETQAESNPNLENYSNFFRRLALSVPHLHRPTKDDLLNVTTGFWQRARVRFKWFTIKSFRRWNADDISAFFTWFLMTQTVWILVGT